MFSLSLMCCRLHAVSSLLRSDSWWYGSSLEWAFLRSLGLPDTQQEVVLPISPGVQIIINLSALNRELKRPEGARHQHSSTGRSGRILSRSRQPLSVHGEAVIQCGRVPSTLTVMEAK
ncbi:hypothetical protein ILYODFUR_026304 [Ilyodon furcidens]|uniref:Uncharacterized protein n=1 Tax=Ilyodon furcidens TaxID=33524 RepID=A0ABV0U1L5_9TELE